MKIVYVDSSEAGYDAERPQVRIVLEDGSIIIMELGTRYPQ